MPQLNAISLVLWSLIGAGIIAVLVLLIRAERNWFRQRDKGTSWLIVRLSSLPAAGIAITLAIASNTRIGSFEPLLVFLISLFSVVPLLYFGSHWLAGKLVRPRLHDGEALWIAVSGLMMVAGPATLISMANPYVHMAAGTEMARGFPELKADPAPVPHETIGARRFAMPTLPVAHAEQWRFPPGIEVVRLDLDYGGQFIPLPLDTSSHLCRRGNDIHLFWLSTKPLPRWRLYWKTSGGPLKRSEWDTISPAGAPGAFEPDWAADSVRLPVSLPVVSVQFLRTGINDVQSIAEPSHPKSSDSCLPQKIDFDDASPSGRISELVLRGYTLVDGQFWREPFRRPH